MLDSKSIARYRIANLCNVRCFVVDVYEQELLDRGVQNIAGVDEAGRGPLAGPVVAAVCHIPPHVEIEGIGDSKALSAKRRDSVYQQLKAHPEVVFELGIVHHEEVDRINILQASFAAMLLAIQKMKKRPEHLLIDGHLKPATDIPCTPLVQGDSKSRLIGAASIIAKVTRDAYMIECHRQWPEYGFDQHKGYPTKLHLEMVERHGLSPIHRRSFKRRNQALSSERS